MCRFGIVDEFIIYSEESNLENKNNVIILPESFEKIMSIMFKDEDFFIYDDNENFFFKEIGYELISLIKVYIDKYNFYVDLLSSPEVQKNDCCIKMTTKEIEETLISFRGLMGAILNTHINKRTELEKLFSIRQ